MISFLVYKRIQVLRKKNTKTLFYKETEENQSLINAMEPLDYIPSFITPTYLAQGIYHEYCSKKELDFKRQFLVNTEDNGVISIDWCVTPSLNGRNGKHMRLLIIVHGLAGGSEQNYIRDITEEFKDSYQVVVIHARGINDTPLGTPKLYHAGFTMDLNFAIDYIRKNFNFKHRFLMGISMGANITYKLLANTRSFDDYFTGYINISNFFNQLATVIKNSGNLTDYFLLNSKKGYLRKHVDMVSYNANIEIKTGFNATTVRDFDNEILVKMHGFSDSEDYYSSTESGPDISKLLNIKTLILVAKDDPIVHLFERDYKKSKNIYLQYDS